VRRSVWIDLEPAREHSGGEEKEKFPLSIRGDPLFFFIFIHLPFLLNFIFSP
jgi:hypothetical protein